MIACFPVATFGFGEDGLAVDVQGGPPVTADFVDLVVEYPGPLFFAGGCVFLVAGHFPGVVEAVHAFGLVPPNAGAVAEFWRSLLTGWDFVTRGCGTKEVFKAAVFWVKAFV